MQQAQGSKSGMQTQKDCVVETPHIETVFLSMKTLICTVLCLLFLVVGWDFSQC